MCIRDRCSRATEDIGYIIGMDVASGDIHEHPGLRTDSPKNCDTILFSVYIYILTTMGLLFIFQY